MPEESVAKRETPGSECGAANTVRPTRKRNFETELRGTERTPKRREMIGRHASVCMRAVWRGPWTTSGPRDPTRYLRFAFSFGTF